MRTAPLLLLLCACTGKTPEATDDSGTTTDTDVETTDPTDTEPTDTETGPEKNVAFVFLTDANVNGDLVSLGPTADALENADALCQAEAEANELPGTFRAYLSSATVNAAQRIEGEGPWFVVEPAGLSWVRAFDDKAAIASGPKVPLSRTGSGALDFGYAWTGSSGGAFSNQDCIGFTDSTEAGGGTAGKTTEIALWEEDQAYACNSEFSIYCFSDL